MLAAILQLFTGVAGFFTAILPASPFQNMTIPQTFIQGLGWLNWLVPIGDMLGLMGAVLGILVVTRVAMYLVGTGYDMSKLATGGK